MQYSEIAAEGAAKLNSLGTYVAAALILILFGVSIFLVSNTVSIGVTVRKDEIAIMKLIGAANGFIKAPFYMEGVIIGIAGSAIPILIYLFWISSHHILDGGEVLCGNYIYGICFSP